MHPIRILVFGTFDHLHPGHRFLLDQASARGDVFVVVARDANVLAIKEREPDQPEAERAAAIRSAYPQATVVLGDNADYTQPIRDIAPDLILFGYDQQLPPGLTEKDIPCPSQRLPAFKPEEYKSSLRRGRD